MDPGPPAGRHALRGIGRTGPAHYGVDEIPLDRLAGRAATIEATDLGAGDLLGVGRIEAWEEEHDSIEAGDRVLIRYGWDHRWTTGPEGRRFLEDWPGLSGEAAEYLVDKGVSLVGCDTLAIDAAVSTENPATTRCLAMRCTSSRT